MMEVMKPCPLFMPGERHDLSVRWKENARVIECSCGMGLYGENFDGYGSASEAIEAWNTRLPTPDTSKIDAAVEALEVGLGYVRSASSMTAHAGERMQHLRAIDQIKSALSALKARPADGEE